MANTKYAKIDVIYGAELWGIKTEQGYEYEIFYPMEEYGEDKKEKISYNEAVSFMIEGTNKREEDVKEYLLF